MDLVSRFSERSDYHQSARYSAVMERIGWSSIPVGKSRLFVHQLGPVSLAKLQRANSIDFQELWKLRRKLSIIHLIIEPACTGTLIDREGKSHRFSFLEPDAAQGATRLFLAQGLSKSSDHYAHSKTMLLDLSKGTEHLVQQFPSKARYNVKISKRPGVEYNVGSFASLTRLEIDEVLSLHSSWMAEKKAAGYSNDFLQKFITAFGVRGTMIRAFRNEKLCGMMMTFVHDRIGYYFYTCTSPAGRASHVPTGLLYHALQESEKRGATIFDFCSVFDERYPQQNPKWQGFTQFKMRFAPTALYYPPTFHRWV